jgi:hypothetical protein
VSTEGAGARGVVFRPKQSRFLTIPQAPLSYWLRERFFELLAGPTLGDVADVVQGLATANDPRFVRFVWEVPPLEWGREVRSRRWVPFEKGGGYGKWFGHHFWVVDWEYNGARIKATPNPRVQNEQYYFKPGWTYSYMARGSYGLRELLPVGVFAHISSAVVPKIGKRVPAAALNARLSSFLVRALAGRIQLTESYIWRLPIPSDSEKYLSTAESACVLAKMIVVQSDLTERTYSPTPQKEKMLAEVSEAAALQLRTVQMILLAVEGSVERQAFASYGLASSDIAPILDETGTPAGWHPLVAGYDAIPPFPDDIKLDPDLLVPLMDHPRIKPTPDELADLKRRLRTMHEAGPGASPEANEEAEAADTDDDEPEEAAVSGARIPIPAETFLEELSQKLEIHPISVYWLLRELREKKGVICLPELRRFVSDHFSVMVLRVLGHRWPKQVEAGEPIPEWAEPAGIIPITEGTGRESLISRVRKRIAADFGAERVSTIEREFEEIMGVALEVWLARDFFRNHISQFRKRPIAWQIQTTPETSNGASNGRGKRTKRKTRADRAPIFSCLLYYHRLDDQLLGTVRTQYAHPMRLRMETELRELERIDAKARKPVQEDRRADLIVRIEELKDFEIRLQNAERDGFVCEPINRIASKEPLDKWTSPDGKKEHTSERDAFMAQEKRYDPDINDGVRVNVAPLQKAGLLAADVLAAKDIEKAISDRAEWRADERRWCRDAKLPHPGWWRTS